MELNENTILVTGGSGLVGKHLQDILPNAVYISSRDYDLTQINQVNRMMEHFNPEIVVHLAARVGGIMDNIKYPVQYLEQNVAMNTNILKSSHDFSVKKVIGILSTCIYPDKSERYPMREQDLFSGPPAESNFSYALAKRCMATHIDSYVKQYGKEWCYLTPCNLYSEYDKFSQHHSHFVAALIRKLYEASDEISLYGTGRPLRQFMYGGDLAKIIKWMLENNIVENFNVAPKEVYSIKEIAEIGRKACNKENIEITFDSSKPDGQYRKDVSSKKLFDVLGGSFNFTPLGQGIEKVYDIFSKRHNK